MASAANRNPPGSFSKAIGVGAFAVILLIGAFSFYRAVIQAPILDPERPYTGNFNALFNTADTHLAAARIAIAERQEIRGNPALGPLPPADIALNHINISLRHRPGNAYAWVMKAQQEILVNRTSKAPDRYDEAARALRISNRLAPNAINLTGPRLELATRMWWLMNDADKAEIKRQIRTTWFDQGPKSDVARIAAKNALARRLVRQALADDPEKSEDFKARLATAKRLAR